MGTNFGKTKSEIVCECESSGIKRLLMADWSILIYSKKIFYLRFYLKILPTFKARSYLKLLPLMEARSYLKLLPLMEARCYLKILPFSEGEALFENPPSMNVEVKFIKVGQNFLQCGLRASYCQVSKMDVQITNVFSIFKIRGENWDLLFIEIDEYKKEKNFQKILFKS